MLNQILVSLRQLDEGVTMYGFYNTLNHLIVSYTSKNFTRQTQLT